MAQALMLKGVKDVVNYTSTDSTFSLRLKQNLRGGDVHQIKQWWAVNRKNTVYNPCTVFDIVGTDYQLIIPTCVSSQLRIGYDGDVYDFIFSQYNQVDRAAVFTTDGTLCVEYQFPSISGGTILKRTLVTPGTTIGSLSASGPATVDELNVGKNYTSSITGGDATGVTYLWTSSPTTGVVINNSTQATASMVFVQDGTYTFTCTASDTGANNSPQTATVSTTVSATEIGTVSVTGAATPPVSTSTNYTASTSGDSTNESYAWTCSPNTASLSGQSSANLTATFSAAGTYTLTCTVTDTHSSDNPQVGTKTVTVPTTIGSVSIGGTATPANNTSVNYTASNSGSAQDITYLWSASPTGTSQVTSTTSQTCSFEASAAGSYVLTCVLSSSTSSDSPVTKTKTLTVS